MEAADAADEFVAAGRDDGHLKAAFDGFGSTVGEEGKLEIARGDESDEVRQVSAQWIDQFLRVNPLPVELVEDGFENFGMSMARDVDAEAAQHVAEFFAVDISEARSFVGPFDRGVIGRDGFAVLKEAGSSPEIAVNFLQLSQ